MDYVNVIVKITDPKLTFNLISHKLNAYTLALIYMEGHAPWLCRAQAICKPRHHLYINGRIGKRHDKRYKNLWKAGLAASLSSNFTISVYGFQYKPGPWVIRPYCQAFRHNSSKASMRKKGDVGTAWAVSRVTLCSLVYLAFLRFSLTRIFSLSSPSLLGHFLKRRLTDILSALYKFSYQRIILKT